MTIPRPPFELTQMNTHYDEREALAKYLRDNYASLFSALERKVINALIGDEKTAHVTHPHYVDWIKRRFGSVSSEEVARELVDGVAAFHFRLCERLLADHAAEIVINRCPVCTCIVRTPLARQCLWCGHDWHAPTPADSDSAEQDN